MLAGILDTVTTMSDRPHYNDDFYAWTQHQALVMRSMLVSDYRVDRLKVAEKIEGLGRSERDAVRSQIRRIVEHLLKLAYSPALQPRFDWVASIAEGCPTLGDKVSPTLQRDAENLLSKLYEDGWDRAELGLGSRGEMQATDSLPADCPYTIDQILRRGWYPEPPGEQP
jgi:uncharacterized protein DUF29